MEPRLPRGTYPLRIASGATEGSPRYYLPGDVDEVAIYGSALSATRVQAHYQAAQVGGSNQPPTAVATASPTSGPVPLIVNFDGSGSSDPDGDPITYSWDLNGDGVFGDSTVAKPSYTYTQAGSYTVKLKVTDSKGASSTSSPIAISATNPPNVYRDAVLSDTPAAFWRLGEASGTTTADASGNNRAGSYIDSPTLGLTGALVGDSNTAAGFNGSGQYVQVPFSSALNPSSFTVEAWVYLAGGQGTQRSVVTSRDQGSKMTRGYWLLADSTNTWQLWLGTGGNHWSKLVGPAVTLNQWTHLVASYDGTTARLYVNGVQLASGSRTYVRNVVRPLRLAAGRTEGNPNAFFPGRLDEVAIYSAALSAARVQTHYKAGTGN